MDACGPRTGATNPNLTPTMLRIPRAIVAPLSKLAQRPATAFRSTDRIRLDVAPVGAHLVATNGRALAIVPLQSADAAGREYAADAPQESSLLPDAAVQALKGTGSKARAPYSFLSSNGNLKVYPSDPGKRALPASEPVGQFEHAPETSGAFPDWRAVVPYRSESTPSVVLDPKLLRELLAVMEASGADAVRLQMPKDDRSPVRIDALRKSDLDAPNTATGVLMPIEKRKRVGIRRDR